MAFPNYMRDDEKVIVGKIIDRALAAGFCISVYDGVAWAIKFSKDREAIITEVAATDVTTLRFRSQDGENVRQYLGEIILIHGNGEDVVHDHSDNKIMRDLCQK